jgi:hypothetical protein
VGTPGSGRGAPNAEAPILEEEGDGVEALEAWEEWRGKLPAVLLDDLANFHAARKKSAEDSQTGRLDDVQVLQSLLKIPQQAIVDEIMAEELGPPSDTSLSVASLSLPRFLRLCYGALARAEWQHADSFCGLAESHRLRETFAQYSNPVQLVPITHLFQIIRAVELPQLNLETLETQRWIAEVTGNVVERRSARARREREGALSYEELVTVVTVATRGLERRELKEALQREQEARKATGFSHAEMEDLRELYGFYSTFGLQSDFAGYYPRIRELLHRSGAKRLERFDQMFIRNLVDGALPCTSEAGDTTSRCSSRASQHSSRCREADRAPFPVFVGWMRAILDRGIEGLEHRHMSSVEAASDRPGFAGALLQECAAQKSRPHFGQRRTPRAGSADASGAEFGEQSQSESELPSDDSLDEDDVNIKLSSIIPAMGLFGMTGARKDSHSNRSSNRSSGVGSIKSPHYSRRASSKVAPWKLDRSLSSATTKSTGIESMSLGTDSLDSASVSCGSSGDPSRRSSGLLVGGSATGDGQNAGMDEECGGQSVLRMKGLPPSEAMLSRRVIRACSVDHGREDLLAVTPVADDAIQGTSAGVEKQEPRHAGAGGAVAGLQALSDLQVFAPKTSQGPHARKVKPVQDADTVVREAAEAILRLQTLGLAERD